MSFPYKQRPACRQQYFLIFVFINQNFYQELCFTWMQCNDGGGHFQMILWRFYKGRSPPVWASLWHQGLPNMGYPHFQELPDEFLKMITISFAQKGNLCLNIILFRSLQILANKLFCLITDITDLWSLEYQLASSKKSGISFFVTSAKASVSSFIITHT